MKKLLLPAALIVLLAAGGIAFFSLHQQWQQTRQTLEQSQSELSDREKTLALIEAEKQQLSESHEALKNRLGKTEEELRSVKNESARAGEQLASASSERLALQQRLADADKKQADLQREFETLRQKIGTEERQRADLQSQLKSAEEAALSRAAELEQASALAAKQQKEAQVLEERLEALSHAFEQLAWKHIELQEAAGQSTAASLASADAPIDFPDPEESTITKRQSEQFAKRYRQLGEYCMAAYQYPQAADAFERSLSFKEDPDLHATLAFLYGRLYLDPKKAALHTALAPKGKITAEETLDATNAPSGMPRSGRNVLWRWLANK